MNFSIKRTVICSMLAVVAIQSSFAQPWPRKEHLTMDNNKKMTDANVSLFGVHSDYDFPYEIPSRKNVTEKLTRILKFLEQATPKAIADPKTGELVTDYKKIPDPFVFEAGDFRPFTYEWGVTYGAMLQAADVTGDPAFREYVTKRMRLFSDIAPEVNKRISKNPHYDSPISRMIDPKNLDQCGSFCASMMKTMSLGEQGIELRPYIDHSTDWLMKRQYRLADGSVARKEPYESTLWLDDMYMSISMLSQLFRATGDRNYLDDAIRQVVQFSERMFDTQSGLYLHCWVDIMNVHPRLSWGRANGWATLAMCDLLDVMPAGDPTRQKVIDQFEAHCRGVMQYQAKNGMWHQLIDRNDSYLESSCTAMFVYGVARGINNGWLDAKAFGPAALLGWNGLSTQINNTGQIENVCVGTGVSFEPGYYYYRWTHPYTAHGYGPVVLAGSEIIRLVENFRIEQKTAIYFFERK